MTYYFDNYPNIGFIDPTISRVGKIDLPENFLNGNTLSCWVYFSSPENFDGDFAVYLEDVTVNNFNGEEGDIGERIWAHMNEYHTIPPSE